MRAVHGGACSVKYTTVMANLFFVCIYIYCCYFGFLLLQLRYHRRAVLVRGQKKSMTHPLWCLFTGEHWSGALNPLPLEGEPAHPANVQLGSVSNYLCCFMLTCAYYDDSSHLFRYTAGMTRIDSGVFEPGWEDRLGITPNDVQWVETGERLTPESFAEKRASDMTPPNHFGFRELENTDRVHRTP